MNEIVELINQAQIRFMASYKEVHKDCQCDAGNHARAGR